MADNNPFTSCMGAMFFWLAELPAQEICKVENIIRKRKKSNRRNPCTTYDMSSLVLGGGGRAFFLSRPDTEKPMKQKSFETSCPFLTAFSLVLS